MIAKAWHATGHKGLFLLAIVTVVGELHYLAMKTSGWLLPSAMTLRRVIVSAWFSAIIGTSAAVAWWLHNKHLAPR